MTLSELNSRDRRGFVEAVGWVFERSDWVAERTWAQRPFASIDALHDAMIAKVASATLDEQLALLRAHPDLGARADMSDASAAEQTGAGLDTLARRDLDRLSMLNSAYRDKFGFPFLYAVKGSTKEDILNALEKRLSSARDTELGEALRQVYCIARFRLDEIFRSRR
jgi:2-oxo-4-hydroxy-4-carboxy-5-ureidoimidazoline decarboxylase